MNKDICRAITFINYHIPIPTDEVIRMQYATTGFFDGMTTERMAVNYSKEGLKSLWQYVLKMTIENKGVYSYQSTYCFSRDEWNSCEDEEFWKEETDRNYPLTFVVFLQLKEYRDSTDRIAEQCRNFNGMLREVLGENGISYSYGTLDKNDFVICIKSRSYKKAVKGIEKLHKDSRTGLTGDVVYSYTVFSVSTSVFPELSREKYPDTWNEVIDSICLKGIANSYNVEKEATLDQKYRQFCERLIDRLYPAEQKKDYKLYDILGDNDFRLIARHVQLGPLISQLAPDGMLHVENREFRFCLFSTNLVLNTSTSSTGRIESSYVERNLSAMGTAFRSPNCEKLGGEMEQIRKTLLLGQAEGQVDDKAVTFCHAVWQLLQSLKALERAPVKKYDFYSLYHPFSLLVHMLEHEMEKAAEDGNKKDVYLLSCNEDIYEFIQKISMTLHGTLRTDIQFFQIRDFNAVVHYAPAKLRAFYALWALRLSKYYNSFNDENNENEYSFIFSPGMFPKISICPLFKEYEGTRRLMLINVPERNLYEPKWLSLILSHEVCHFVGYSIRNRPARHKAWLHICARVFTLEMMYFRYRMSNKKYQNNIETAIGRDHLFETELISRLEEEDIRIRKERGQWPHEFHSDNSIKVVKRAFREIACLDIEKFVADDCGRIHNYVWKQQNIRERNLKEYMAEAKELREVIYASYEQQLLLFGQFQQRCLTDLLKIIRYIMSEAYADLIAVLTLGLKPVDYVSSFFMSELRSNSLEKSIKDAPLLVVRLGMTIEALRNTVMKNKDWFEQKYSEFQKSWCRDVIRELPLYFSGQPVSEDMAVKTYGYVSRIRNCTDSIRTYGSIYDYDTEIGGFHTDKLDFLNDVVVWNEVGEYLARCAQTYVDRLKGDDDLWSEKKRLEDTYHIIAGDSPVKLMQEVENFLAAVENYF